MPQLSCGTATLGLPSRWKLLRKGQSLGGEIAMAKFYIKRLKTRAILSPSRLMRCSTCTFRPGSIPGGHPFQSGPAGPVVRGVHPWFIRFIVTLPGGRAGKKRNDMDSAKRCRDQSAECLRLMKLAQSQTEARVLRDLARKSDRPIYRVSEIQWASSRGSNAASRNRRCSSFGNQTRCCTPTISLANRSPSACLNLAAFFNRRHLARSPASRCIRTRSGEGASTY